MRFRTAPEDRERLGVGEFIDFDITRFSNREADLLESQVPDPADPTRTITPGRWMELLEGEIAEDGDGAPIVDEKTGKPVMTYPRATVARVYWLALRRAGSITQWSDFYYDVWWTRIVGDDTDPAGEPGKRHPATGR